MIRVLAGLDGQAGDPADQIDQAIDLHRLCQEAVGASRLRALAVFFEGVGGEHADVGRRPARTAS